MQAQTAASPGVESGNLRKRIAILNQVLESGAMIYGPDKRPRLALTQLYREHLIEQLEWLTDELSVSDAQLELALFPEPPA